MEEVFKIDEAKIRGHVDQVVRESVEETLNSLLDAEADALCHAKRYEHSVERELAEAELLISERVEVALRDEYAPPE